jgi:hypothetical protein
MPHVTKLPATKTTKYFHRAAADCACHTESGASAQSASPSPPSVSVTVMRNSPSENFSTTGVREPEG